MELSLYIPTITLPRLDYVWAGMVEVGFAQLFLTASNAVIATRVAVEERFGCSVGDEKLVVNMGFMNLAAGFVGSIPLCHGVGGFAAQYYYGARSGGAMVMEGVVEVFLALVLAPVTVLLFSRFPQAMLGVMLLPVVWELGRSFMKLRSFEGLTVGLVTTALSMLTNMGVGFLVGFMTHHIIKRVRGL